jgi:hypothetical protein
MLFALLAGCTGQGVAAMSDGPAPVKVSCDTAKPTTVDQLWTRYLQSASTSGTGGCAFMSCHGGVNGGGGMHFATAKEFVKQTVGVPSSGDPSMMRVKMKAPAESYLFQMLLPDAGERQMPPGGPYLDDQGIAEVLGWICSDGSLPNAGQ